MDLEGQLLIAMPGIGDARFDRSVIQIMKHDDQGAMGLVVNMPFPDVSARDLLDQLDLPLPDDAGEIPVFLGGPVEGQRGFVLHSDDYQSELQTLSLDCGVSMTVTLDILQDISEGKGPNQSLLLLGYAGWGPGQLENEIARNGWLTLESSCDLIFDVPAEKKWTHALGKLGIDPLILSDTAGRA